METKEFVNLRLEKIEIKVEEINKELGTKVSWVVFWSIMLTVMAVVGSMWVILYKEVKEVRNVGDTTRNDVSYIKGIFDRAEIIK